MGYDKLTALINFHHISSLVILLKDVLKYGEKRRFFTKNFYHRVGYILYFQYLLCAVFIV